MRTLEQISNGTPSDIPCLYCDDTPFQPLFKCPECEHKSHTTNICKRCDVHMILTGKESHECSIKNRLLTRGILELHRFPDVVLLTHNKKLMSIPVMHHYTQMKQCPRCNSWTYSLKAHNKREHGVNKK